MLSAGDILRKEREKRGLTLRQVEKEIRVREKFLQAIEENNWNSFPSKIYIIGILKNYAKFLNIDTLRLIPIFNRDYEKQEEVEFKKRLSASYLTPQSKKIAIATVVCVLLLFTLYFGYQLKQFLSPPKVVITAPTVAKFRSVDQVEVRGKTEKEAIISIFGEKVYPDKDGNFIYQFPLKKGVNKLIIEVVGGNGKKTIVTREYIRE